jgi:hypothetical protein
LAQRDFDRGVQQRVVPRHLVGAVLRPEPLDHVRDAGRIVDRSRRGVKLRPLDRQQDLRRLPYVAIPIAVCPAAGEEEKAVAVLDEPDRPGALAAGLAPGDGELDLVGVLQGVLEISRGTSFRVWLPGERLSAADTTTPRPERLVCGPQ